MYDQQRHYQRSPGSHHPAPDPREGPLRLRDQQGDQPAHPGSVPDQGGHALRGVPAARKKELITSYEGDISLGGRRRYYSITPLGRAFFREEVQEWRKTKEIIDIFMELEEQK